MQRAADLDATGGYTHSRPAVERSLYLYAENVEAQVLWERISVKP